MDFKLILKKLKGALTKEEEVIFDNWFHESKTHREYFYKVKKNYKKDLGHIDLEKAWKKVKRKSYPNSKTYQAYAIAASMALLIGLCFYYFNQNKIAKDLRSEPPIVSIKEKEIVPGSDKAVLELENGESIVLEKEREYTTEHFKSTGKSLTYSSLGDKFKVDAYNILMVPRGGQFHLVLSDGTSVYLNSETKLKYPITFSENGPRKVELLYGEAYFEVTPSSENGGRHFIVSNKNQDIEVLGTQFNIKAYKEDNFINTTLVEGKVQVANGINSFQLKPNDQSQLDLESNSFSISKVDVFNEISWRRGVFSFKNKPLSEIMKVLSRWYDVDFEFRDSLKSEIRFNGTFNKKTQIQDILSIIENANEAKFNIKGKKIIME